MAKIIKIDPDQLKGKYIKERGARVDDPIEIHGHKILKVFIETGHDGIIRTSARVKIGSCTFYRWLDNSMIFVDKKGQEYQTAFDDR
jgi:hypothetical protein